MVHDLRSVTRGGVSVTFDHETGQATLRCVEHGIVEVMPTGSEAFARLLHRFLDFHGGCSRGVATRYDEVTVPGRRNS